MNFDSILIITYGRSGSTLLQGIMNSHDEVLVRGENFNFCQGLYQSHNALTKTKKHKLGTVPTNPFFGSVYFDEAYFLSMARKMVKNLLFGDQIGNEKIKCYGFKEIRYEKNPLMLEGYLEFLKLVFPNPAFVINTRNKEDVLKSREKNEWRGKRSMESLEKTEKAFFDFRDKNLDCTFHITYEDVVGKTERLSLLHSFLGLPYSDEEINKVMSIQHSNTNQREKSNLQNPSKQDFRIVSFEDRHIAQLEKELRLREQNISSMETFSIRKFLGSLFSFRKRK